MIKVGTVCVGVNHILDTHRNGVECVVEKLLVPPGGLYRTTHSDEVHVSQSGLYKVVWADGYVGNGHGYACTESSRLRPKQLPADTANTGELAILNLFKEMAHG